MLALFTLPRQQTAHPNLGRNPQPGASTLARRRSSIFHTLDVPYEVQGGHSRP